MKPAAQKSIARASAWRRPGSALAAALVAFATVLVGCSKNDGGGSPAYNPYLYGANGCVGCGNGGSSIGTAMGRVIVYGNVGIELQLQFFTAQGNYSPAGSGYISQVGYSGNLGAAGYLNVFVNPAQWCPIAPGRYPVQTARAGSLSGNSVYGLILEGTNIAVSVANAYIQQAIPGVQSQADGAVFQNSIVGRVQIMPATGYCQSIDLSGQVQNFYEDKMI